MNVSLTPELEQFVANKVKSGRYTSASEVVREALRLLEEREQLRHLQKHELQKKITDGLDQLARGEGIPGEAVFAELDAELDAFEQPPTGNEPLHLCACRQAGSPGDPILYCSGECLGRSASDG